VLANAGDKPDVDVDAGTAECLPEMPARAGKDVLEQSECQTTEPLGPQALRLGLAPRATVV
jgi:hypothetical protein